VARFGLALLVGLLLASWAPSAPAHLRFPTVKAERFIELRLVERPIRIGYRVGFGASLASEQRRLADRDSDFSVSASEGNAALDARTEALLQKLRVCTGRSLEELRCRSLERRDIERVEAEGWTPEPPGHLHFAWTFRLAETAPEIGALRVEDAYEVDGVEITDVQIQPPGHTPLLRAGDALLPAGVAERFSWVEARREPGPRGIVATWAPPPKTNVVPVIVLGILVILGLAGLSWYRRVKPDDVSRRASR